MVDLYKYENELYDKGLNFIGGVDEVGRGPLIGSVVAACVVLPRDFVLVRDLRIQRSYLRRREMSFIRLLKIRLLLLGLGL